MITATSYIATLVFSPALLLMLGQLHRQSLGNFALGGCIAGFVTALALDLPHIQPQRGDYYLTAVMAGAMTATVFGLLWREPPTRAHRA
jgi:hypothetical protein